LIDGWRASALTNDILFSFQVVVKRSESEASRRRMAGSRVHGGCSASSGADIRLPGYATNLRCHWRDRRATEAGYGTGPPTAQDRSGALLRRMGLSNACGLPEGGIKREYAAGVVLKLRSRGSCGTPYAHFNVFNVPPHRADDSFYVHRLEPRRSAASRHRTASHHLTGPNARVATWWPKR